MYPSQRVGQPFSQLPVTIVSQKDTAKKREDQRIKQFVEPTIFYKAVKDNEKAIKNLSSRIAKWDKVLSTERKSYIKDKIRKDKENDQHLLNRAMQDRIKYAQTIGKIDTSKFNKKMLGQIEKAEQEITKGNKTTLRESQKNLEALNRSPFFRKRQFSSDDLDKIAELMQDVDRLEKQLVLLDFQSASKLNKHKLRLGQAFVMALGGYPPSKKIDGFLADHLNRLLREQERRMPHEIDPNKLRSIKYATQYLDYKLRSDPVDQKKLEPINERLALLQQSHRKATQSSDIKRQKDLETVDALLDKLYTATRYPPLNVNDMNNLLDIKYQSNNPMVQQRVNRCIEQINSRSEQLGKHFDELERTFVESRRRNQGINFLGGDAWVLMDRAWRGEPYLAKTLETEVREIARTLPHLKNDVDFLLLQLEQKTQVYGKP